MTATGPVAIVPRAMREITSVYILGAGGLGAAYGSRIHLAQPGLASFLAHGARAERLRREGVKVNDQHFLLPVVEPAQAAQPDLVLLTVKYHHIDEAVAMLKPVVGPHTLVLSLLNGIDSEEILSGHFPAEQIIHGMSLGIDAVRSGKSIRCKSFGVIHFGRPRNNPPSDAVRAIQQLFTRCDIQWETPDDMLRALWWKFMINVGINQVSAVLNMTYHGFQHNRYARSMMHAAMREVIAVAQARGIALSEEDINRFDEVIPRLAPDGKTSMLQDVEERRKTEVEMLAGKVIEIGRELNIDTPVNTVLFDLLRARETDYL